MKRAAFLTAWLCLLAVTAVVLTATAPAIGGVGRDPQDVAVSVTRTLHVLSAVLAWYLLLATSLSIAAQTLRLRTLGAIADRLAIPAVRFVVASALGVSALSPAGPALADHTPPTSAADAESPTMRLLAPPDAAPGAEGNDGSPPERAAGPYLAASPPAPPATSVVVAPGDHLWGIAARHLEQVTGRVPTDAETARYWSVVVELNTPRLASGDPDLIRPGEVVELPPVHADWAS